MISDDDSILSAYLDGQLDADEQRRVELDLVAHPRLAEELRSLTVLRDLVAGLAHDATVNVAPEVMKGIRCGSARPRRIAVFHWWPADAWRPITAIGGLAAAAALILAVSLAISRSKTPAEFTSHEQEGA